MRPPLAQPYAGPRTLADEPGLTRQYRVHKDAPFDPSCTTTEVFAPCCGRRVAADAVLDVRGVPGTVVRGGGHRPAKDHDWLCDGCRDRMIREAGNPWTAATLMEQCGAPIDAVRSLKLHERLCAAAMDDLANGRAHEPDKAHARVVVDVEREMQALAQEAANAS